MAQLKSITGFAIGAGVTGLIGYYAYKKLYKKVPNTLLVCRIVSTGGVLKTVDTTPCGRGGAIDVWGWLADSSGFPLQGYEVYMVDANTGEEFFSEITDKDGKISITLMVEEKYMPDSKLTYELKLRFKGFGSFDPVESNKITIHFTKPCAPAR